MELDECILGRRSIRKFSPQEIAAPLIATIIKAGTNAPSAGNIQEWKFIVVTDDALKENIAKACEEQIWMANAGALIVICTDNRDMKRFYGEPAETYCIQDASAAAMLMLLKSYELGLGSCWVVSFDGEMLKELLGMPTFMTPQMVIAVGYSVEKTNEKPRLRLEEVIYLNKYGKRAVEYPEMGEIIKKLIEKSKKTAKKCVKQ